MASGSYSFAGPDSKAGWRKISERTRPTGANFKFFSWLFADNVEHLFVAAQKDEKATTWLIPKLVGEAKFTEWTSEGEMRHPGSRVPLLAWRSRPLRHSSTPPSSGRTVVRIALPPEEETRGGGWLSGQWCRAGQAEQAPPRCIFGDLSPRCVWQDKRSANSAQMIAHM
jgi:hypothetical protein